MKPLDDAPAGPRRPRPPQELRDASDVVLVAASLARPKDGHRQQGERRNSLGSLPDTRLYSIPEDVARACRALVDSSVYLGR